MSGPSGPDRAGEGKYGKSRTQKAACIDARRGWSGFVRRCLSGGVNVDGVRNGPAFGCPQVVEVEGGYLLTQDASCSLSWSEDNTFFDLGGYTLTGRLFPHGRNQVVRNGTVVIDRSDSWVFSNNFTVSGVTFEPLTSDPCSFCIEAGSSLTVEYSTFRNFNGITLSFFYGGLNGGGTVRYSTFSGNRIGVSNQRDDGVLIEHNTFSNNVLGVNLWAENGIGVNENTIRQNTFMNNQYGIRIRKSPPPFGGGGRPGSRTTPSRRTSSKKTAHRASSSISIVAESFVFFFPQTT